jgi:hypothetical protein
VSSRLCGLSIKVVVSKLLFCHQDAKARRKTHGDLL